MAYNMQLKVFLVITILSIIIQFHQGVPQKALQVPTNPRQIRSGSPTFNQSTDTVSLKKVAAFINKYALQKNNSFQDYDDTCDPALQKEWGLSGGKDLLSDEYDKGAPIWSNKICNFLNYLDCSETNKRCECASQDKYDLTLVYENKTQISKKKRMCQVVEGELCGYVRILPPVFPGIKFDISDHFDCHSNFTCVLVKEDDAYIYERCGNVTGACRGNLETNWKMGLIWMDLSIIWNYVLWTL